ncbi:tRNA lysidine(34) synthetase TilS [Mucilaginibacter ginkgonis]|uniref:tRNA(Ile)-lysidine synthase n=1 Tax=Mucilaginibacter ginkgonis TaxID=2682091 RepID=A0A6I4I2R3_9SPHI|nr:tRNA lysidine(34) synthetase TilS [Mucilaginibacter ginkgonis]QQL49094.1 tRNA lysidine(34) synthetase TilS [Mucilaginibacter ginkgonis]
MLPLAQFKGFVNSNNLFTTNSKILAAVSGGMDSVLLANMLKAGRYNFAIAHCNFQLRGEEAVQDEAFCRLLAESLQVAFHEIRFNTENYASNNKISIQMAARELRYQWFENVRQQNGYDVIALAHHQNDTVETILLNLTRGTGIAGLHGIKTKNSHLVRPLLFMTRNEIAATIAANDIAYREDSSNASDKYARNKIRHQVVPALKELNPNLEQTVMSEAAYFGELEQLLAMQVKKLKDQVMCFDGDEVRMPISAAAELVPQQLLLSELLSPYGFMGSTVADIIASLQKHSGRIFISPTHRLILDRTDLIISPLTDNSVDRIKITEKTGTVNFGNYKLSLRQGTVMDIPSDSNIAVLDADKFQYPLTVRQWQKGDTFYPLGMKTRKKLSDFFVSQKVPLHKKSSIPLLVNGNGDIVWVCGYRISDRYKITASTKKISIFELTEL